MNENPYHFDILFADDNSGDIELTMEAVQESGVDCSVHVVRDGTDVIAFLNRKGIYSENPRPDLIILDWNMPKMNGPDVIPIIRENPDFALIPVIIFTSSTSEKHIDLAYEIGANCYVIKPVDFDQYIKCMAGIIRFWSKTTRLPARH